MLRRPSGPAASVVQAAAMAIVVIGAASLGWAAEPGSADAALAESLFRQAKRLAKGGDVAEACPKFAESHRLDPQLGTLLHLATCHEQEGKTASAWAEYGEAAEWAGQSGDQRRKKLAEQRMAALEPRLSQLVVEVDDLRDGMTVSLDGRTLGPASLATPLPVDPGPHRLEARAPGAVPWSDEIDVPGRGEVSTIRVPALAGRPADEARRGTTADTSDAQRVAGYVLGGVGVAGLVVMAIFGLRADQQAREADGFCEGRFCTPEGLQLHQDARGSAMVSTVSFVAGLACVGAGLTLVLTAPGDADEVGAVGWVRPVVSSAALGLGTGVRF